jgi:hypothetical protein
VTLSLVPVLAAVAVLDCPDCGVACDFVQPDCADGHGAACPERCCVGCGAAVLLDPGVGDLADVRPLGARRELRGAA